MAGSWTVQLCRNGQPIAVPSAYVFRAKPLRNTAGEWSLETSPAGIPPSGYPDPAGVEPDDVPFDPRDVTSVRLVAEGVIAFAGAVAADNGGFWAERGAAGERWRFTGVEAGWHRLASRLAFPDPAAASGWSVSHDVRTGLASTILAEYIEANLGSSALSERQVDGIEVADELVGPDTTFSARLQTLSELAERIARDGGFEVIPEIDFDGSITYRLSMSRDLSGVLVFSDRGDLSESSARFTQRSATFVLSAGAGEGTSRTFRIASTAATGSDRFEVLSDVSSLSEAAEVQADATARLGLSADQFSISTTLNDSAASLALRAGLRLGDRVGVVVRGRRYSVPIEAIEFEVSPLRQTMRPQFGVAEPNELVALKRRVAGLHDRLDASVA